MIKTCYALNLFIIKINKQTMKYFITLFLFLTLFFQTFGQETGLYENNNYKNAVENNTRSRDGKPGTNYWQNHADYDIRVKLDTVAKMIFGSEDVTYHNDSPDSLDLVVIKLIQNVYKKDALRNMPLDAGNITDDGVIFDTLIIDGKGISPDDSVVHFKGTNMAVKLETKIPPGATLTMHCKWNYQLATVPDSRREGYYKDKAWFIGYFYPQIAVYDDMEFYHKHKGWDLMLFHQGWQEFYNDFNNYKVEIEVPEGFFVWATGTLMNEEDVYSKTILDSIHKAKTTDANVHILDTTNFQKDNLVGNTWKFEATKVPDFAFGTAMDYYWDATSVVINGKHVFVDLAYNPQSVSFPYVLDVMKKSVTYASTKFLAIPYPWEHISIFNGLNGGGMEFPMLANNCDDEDIVFARFVTYHEMFHNYTPFMMGFNEKRYPFMDEGITEASSILFLQDEFKEVCGYPMPDCPTVYRAYEYFAKIQDIPMINAYASISNNNCFYEYYVKPVVAYLIFIDMVGRDEFVKAFREFANRWAWKHPTPWDMFYTFNDVLGENYNWFWKSWFFELGYPDLAVELEKDKIIVKRVGVGSLPLPVKLIVEYKDGSTEKIEKSMKVWKNGDTQISIDVKNSDKIKLVKIDDTNLPDINKSNNKFEVN